jgi:hypothetical protein
MITRVDHAVSVEIFGRMVDGDDPLVVDVYRGDSINRIARIDDACMLD